jgi:hypothetical protein
MLAAPARRRAVAARASALVRRYDWPAHAAAIGGGCETGVGEPVMEEPE